MPAAFEGPLAGYMDVQQGQQAQQLTQEQIRNTQAMARYHDVSARSAEQEMQLKARQAAMSEAGLLMQRAAWVKAQETDDPAGNTPTNFKTAPASQSDKLGGMLETQIRYINNLAGSGMMTEATAGLKAVMENADKLSVIRKNETEDQVKKYEGGAKVASQINSALTGVRDQATFDMAKMQLLSTMPGMPGMPVPPWLSLPYSQAKPMIEKLQNSTKEGMEIAKTQSEIVRNRASASEQAQLAALHKAQTRLEDMELAAQTERAALAKKNGEPLPSVKHPDTKKDNVSGPERLNADQLIRAGNDLYTGLDEIMKLSPGAGLGTFSDLAYSKDPTFIGGMKKWMANKVTDNEMHAYATRLAGVNVAAATIASGGRAPRVSQMEAEKAAIAELSGQSRETALDKIHQASLKAIRGIEMTRGTEEQKNNLELVKARLQGVLDTSEAGLEAIKKHRGSARGGPTEKKSDLPAGIPAGSTIVGTTPEGKPVYQSADGKKWVE